jgi:CO/xanthine dehydrogenase Mo-binding subunit
LRASDTSFDTDLALAQHASVSSSSNGITAAPEELANIHAADRTEARSRLPVGSLRLSVENGKPSDGLDATSSVNWLLLAT